MAAHTAPDSRRNISVAASPQISKDVHGSDNSIPLSPQWLLSKPGEIKPETAPVDINPFPGNPGRSDIGKSWGNEEEMHDTPKKKDVFRPALLEMEAVRRERWRDEERDTISAVRKDRWRDGDKELGDTRKVDRWVENSSARHFGDGRRGTSDRWTDSSSKESTHDQRRESKWNTRWGPDDKETEGLHNKWIDPSKDSDVLLDKGSPSLTNNGKDDREGDYYRPWRSNSSQSRGRLEPPPQHQNHTPNKQSSTFTYGRGRGENASATFSLGRGRIGSGGSFMNISAHSHSLGSVSDKVDGGHGEPLPLRYSRTKLLDVYRRTNTRSRKGFMDEFAQVSTLTLDDSLEPLALCAPTPEELVILKGIDNGDITSSGAPQVTKDGSVGRKPADLMQPRRLRPGSGEDFSSLNDGRNETATDTFKVHYSNNSEGPSLEKHMQSFGSSSKIEGVHGHQANLGNKYNAEGLSGDGASNQKVENVSSSKELNMQGNSSVHPGDMWRSLPMAERSYVAKHDWREISTEFRSKASDMGWSQQQKNVNSLRGSNMVDPSHRRDEPLWQRGDPNIKRQSSGVLEREQETRKVVQLSPEDLQLYYKDPQGEIQGPFSGIDIIGWFEAGYFGLDLQVRSVSAPNDLPFSSLGDVMPHLRAKARPPPGFKKQSEITDPSIRPNFSGLGKLPLGSSDFDMIKSDPRLKSSANTEAENRFLESLMAGNLSSSFDKFSSSEGVQGYNGNNSSAMLSLAAGGENNLLLLAKKMVLERQKSLSTPYPYLLGRDAATIVPKSEVILDSATQQSQLVSSMLDVPQQTSHPQNVDFMSMLQDLSERSSSGVNNGAANRSNFPVQSAVDPRQEKFDLHHSQNFSSQAAFGNQQSRLQVQNHPPLMNLLGQAVDNPTGNLTPENLLSSGLSQNPQLIMLQEKYLQFLNQQQKQEEEQLLLLQQQQFLSRVLPEQHSQRFGELSYGRLQFPVVPMGSSSVDHSQLQSSQELRQMPPVPNVPDEQVSNYLNMPPQVSQNVTYSVSTETSSAHLPHQMFRNDNQQKGWGAFSKQVDETQPKESLLSPVVMDNSRLREVVTKSSHEPLVPQKPVLASDGGASQGILTTNDPASVTTSEVSFELSECLAGASAVNYVKEPLALEQTNQLEVLPVTAVEAWQVEAEQCCDEPSKVKEVKKSDVQDVRKTSEKKSRKQKSSKAHSNSDQAKGVSKVVLSEQTDPGRSNVTNTKFEPQISVGNSKSGVVASEAIDSHSFNSLLPLIIESDAEPVETNEDSWQVGPSSGQNTNAQPEKRAWKPAPGFKAKSLLEIQQEEQRKAEIVYPEVNTSANSMSSSTPWAGVVTNSDAKISREFHQDAGNPELSQAKSQNSKNMKGVKSQLHDLLGGEISVKSNERDAGALDDSLYLSSLPDANIQLDSNDDDTFIEAKDSKKARKKAAKAKGIGAKPLVPNTAINLSVASIPIEKGKSSRSAKEEVSPALPSGPSLGDFVLWKGEPTNSPPAPAWSTDSGKPARPTSLRDILKEQGKKGSSVQSQAQVSAPQKSQPTQTARGSAALRPPSASPSSKGVPPVQSSSHASAQSKHKGDDDLFWGPIEQSKQESKQADFPNLANHGGWGTKNTTLKGASSGPLGRHKSVDVRPADRSLSSTVASVQLPSLKGKRDALNKQSEATDFRDWCESESVRLTGTKDTSFLEFCLKQTRSEAELLLVENLGSFDPNHEFIDKFLNYMELLPADVIEIAFQSRNGCKVTSFSAANADSHNVGAGNIDPDLAVGYEGSSKGSAKKKGKKGKKVSPAVLGFNVVSNRIMMGEIQTVDD